MKKYIALITILLSFSALAEDNKTYTISLTGQEVSYIGQILYNRPYSEVVSLLNKFQSQLSEQDRKASIEESSLKSDAEKYRKEHQKKEDSKENLKD